MIKSNGYADVLIGLQYGDEGKARIVDLFAKDYDIVARFNGGANAGHTIEIGNVKVALNQIPSGIFYPEKILYIGSGCVVNIVKLAIEIKKIQQLGIVFTNRLKISCQASIIQPQHQIIDGIIGKYIGTTKNGIGLCYADKAIRMIENRLVNIRLADLLDDLPETLLKIKANIQAEQLKYGFEIDVDSELNELKESFEFIKEFVQPDTLFLQKLVEKGQKVLFEGAQSVMLDPVKGAVPFVTSGHTIAAAAFTGGDLSLNFYRKTIGVAKALMSRVGYGPFASEIGGKKSEEYTMATNKNGTSVNTKDKEKTLDVGAMIKSQDEFEIGQSLRILSNEYGVVTKRPRRVGHLDLVQLKYACKINNVDELVITKTDLLREYDDTAAKQILFVDKYYLDGEEIDYVPASPVSYYKVTTNKTGFDTFYNSISDIREYDNLPTNAKKTLEYIQEFCECKLVGLGVGPEREQFIKI